MDDEQFYSVNQVALLFKVHPLTIRRYIRERKLKAVKLAGNIRISKTSVDNFTKAVDPADNESKKKTVAVETTIPTFSLDDPIFRLKGRGLSMKVFGTN